MPLRLLDFGIGDAGEVALGVEEVALVLSVEISGIDRTGEVGDEHPVAGNVEGDADPFHQVLNQDLGRRLFIDLIDRRAIDGVAARRIAAVGPIQNAIFEIELEINRLWQAIKQDFNVRAAGRTLPLWDVYVGAKKTTFVSFVWALLRPVDLAALGIDGDTDTPSGLVAAVVLILPCHHEVFNFRAIEIAAHDAHSLSVAPVEFAILLIEMNLLGRERGALRNDDFSILAIDVGALDRPVVQVG